MTGITRTQLLAWAKGRDLTDGDAEIIALLQDAEDDDPLLYDPHDIAAWLGLPNTSEPTRRPRIHTLPDIATYGDHQ